MIFGGNEFLAGGFWLMLLGGAMAYARNLPMRLWYWAESRFLYQVEVDNNDAAFGWLRAWITARSSRARYLIAGVDQHEVRRFGEPAPPKKGPRFYFMPRGLSSVRFRGRRVIVWTHRDKVENGVQWRETISLKVWRGDREFIEAMLLEAWQESVGNEGPRVEVYTPDGPHWSVVDSKTPRPLSTLVMAEGQAERILADVRRFLTQRDWYLSMGIPHRRGYLLEGPPGNGKSSLVHVLASELGVNVNVVNLAGVVSDELLARCMGNVPKGNIVLLEDVDAAFHGRESKRSITFAGFLNALDGMMSQEGRILIMTTNHKEQLDPALIRPGRVDVVEHVGNATPEQAARMFRRFFPDWPKWATLFGSHVPPGTSMARIQEHLLRHRDDPAAATRWPKAEAVEEAA